MRTLHEILEEAKQNSLRSTLRSKLFQQVINNVSGAFEKYYYFIAKKKFIPPDFKIPDIYFELGHKEYFAEVFTRRNKDARLNNEFIHKFKTADFIGSFADFFDAIKKCLGRGL